MKYLSFSYLLIGLCFCSITTAATSNNTKTITLQIVQQPLVVHGKKSFVYRIKQPDGTLGLTAKKGDELQLVVENKINQPSSIHWHGIILPSDQDGVPYITQKPIMPGQSYPYHFKLVQSGTYWMHSHYRLQEQKLLAAPFIIKDSEEKNQYQDVVILLEDFSFTSPREIYKKLRCENFTANKNGMTNHMTMMTMPKADINDVNYDAFLANEHTLSNPHVVRIKPNATIRLRIINAAASTNFYIDIGKLEGRVIAVDGNQIVPKKINPFQLGMAQRVDILVNIPTGDGFYPILGLVEGSKDQTGIVLATEHASLTNLPEQGRNATPAFDNTQEQQLQANEPLQKKQIINSIGLALEGNMQRYSWMINNKTWPFVTPPLVTANDRVELIYTNQTSMSHPMHLHGHTFQVTNIDGKDINGANRDTILVLPHSTVKVQFDANNPGVWMLHCHNLYHAAAGMITKLLYKNYQAPYFTYSQQGSMSGAFLFKTPKECGI